MKLTLEYIAGFFDGEGCVSTHTNRARRGYFGTSIKIAQGGEDGASLLRGIQTWLDSRGIRSYFGVQRKAKGLAHYKEMWALRVCDRVSVVACLRLLRPHVRMKKVVVEDTLRFLLAYPPVKGPLTSLGNKERAHNIPVALLAADRQQGLSYHAIAKKHGLSFGIVYERLNPDATAAKVARRRERRLASKTDASHVQVA